MCVQVVNIMPSYCLKCRWPDAAAAVNYGCSSEPHYDTRGPRYDSFMGHMMVVAALITTVTFAALIIPPGGISTGEGSIGRATIAILADSRKADIRNHDYNHMAAFLWTDSLAVILSMSSIVCILGASGVDHRRFLKVVANLNDGDPLHDLTQHAKWEKHEFKAFYYIALACLFGAGMCALAAAILAAWITFDGYTADLVGISVMAVMPLAFLLWNIFTPISPWMPSPLDPRVKACERERV